MTPNAPAELQPTPARWMTVIGGVVLAAVACYALFMAVDGTGLSTHSASARVIDKQYREPGTTYTTQVIGGAARTLPQVTEEQFLVLLDIGGAEALAAVSQPQYRALARGQVVQVGYQQRRLTGSLQVIDLDPSPPAR